jgi:hypothetical protein
MIPGVGPKISQSLWNIGLRSIDDLRNRDPEDMYEQLCLFQGTRVDRCVLYVFRCAVYFVSNERHDSKLLKWWNWKDRIHANRPDR